MHLSQSLSDNHCCVSSSINGDGAAEPVPDNPDEGEEENEAEEFSSSWPTAFTSTASDTEESDAPKQVQRPAIEHSVISEMIMH